MRTTVHQDEGGKIWLMVWDASTGEEVMALPMTRKEAFNVAKEMLERCLTVRFDMPPIYEE